MKSFHYRVLAEHGIHARPAGALAKIAKKYACHITISCAQRTCDVKRLVSLMKLEVKQGEEITISIQGPDEGQAAAELTAYIQTHL